MRTGIAVVGLFLTACSANRPSAGRLHPAMEAALRTRIDQLRGAFNQGSCGSIWDSAHPLFQRQSREEWLDTCAALHADLGDWTSAEVAAGTNVAGFSVQVTSQSRFSSGRLRVILQFESAAGDLRLSGLALSRHGRMLWLPPTWPTAPPDLRMDPLQLAIPRG